MSPLKIAEAARKTGLPARTIRFYEAEGVLPAPARTRANYRVYGEHDLTMLRLIRHGRDLGFSHDDLRRLSGEAARSDCQTFVALITDAVAAQRRQIDDQLRGLRALRSQLDAFERRVRAAPCAQRSDQSASQCGVALIEEQEIDDGTDRKPAPARRPRVRHRGAPARRPGAR